MPPNVYLHPVAVAVIVLVAAHVQRRAASVQGEPQCVGHDRRRRNDVAGPSARSTCVFQQVAVLHRALDSHFPHAPRPQRSRPCRCRPRHPRLALCSGWLRPSMAFADCACASVGSLRPKSDGVEAYRPDPPRRRRRRERERRRAARQRRCVWVPCGAAGRVRAVSSAPS